MLNNLLQTVMASSTLGWSSSRRRILWNSRLCKAWGRTQTGLLASPALVELRNFILEVEQESTSTRQRDELKTILSIHVLQIHFLKNCLHLAGNEALEETSLTVSYLDLLCREKTWPWGYKKKLYSSNWENNSKPLTVGAGQIFHNWFHKGKISLGMGTLAVQYFSYWWILLHQIHFSLLYYKEVYLLLSLFSCFWNENK